jgi:dTDP-4-amino-4,6-dideoxygalactose transaminase
MPAITIKAFADIIEFFELTPVFVDTSVKTGSFDLAGFKNALKENPRVVLLTYLFGIVPNIDMILEAIGSKNLYVIEDFSQCLDGQFKNRKVGSFGHISILSTSSVKTLDTYGGGLAFTNDLKLANSITKLQSGFDYPSRKILLKKALNSSVKNLLTHRLSFLVFVYPLVFIAAFFKLKLLSNFVGRRSKILLKQLPEEWFTKLSCYQAKFGLRMLDTIEERNKKRISIALRYSKLASFIGSDPIESSFNIYWQTIFLVSDVNRVRLHLALRGIDCSTTSLVLISSIPFKNNQSEVSTPQAELIVSRGVYFPCYHQLTENEVQKIEKILFDLNTKKLITSP